MARATRIDSVQLTLTSDEAQTLYDLLYYSVGGDPERTRRKYTEPLRLALEGIGFDKSIKSDMDGSVYFKSK